jgi:hypothetical protein
MNLENKVRDQVLGQVWNQVGNQVRWRIYEQVRDQVWWWRVLQKNIKEEILINET